MNTQSQNHAESNSSQNGQRRLSDTALLLLGQAGMRPDGMLLPPPAALRARGGALAKVLGLLLKSALVSEVPVDTEEQSWRIEESQQRIGLKITAAGLAALGMAPPPAEDVSHTMVDTGPITPELPDEAPHAPGLGSNIPEPTSSDPGPRRMTKQVQLVTLLSGDQGQSIAALAETLGWQHHTVRAALTGLRQKGHMLSKTKDADGRTVYRIMAPDTAAPNSTTLAA